MNRALCLLRDALHYRRDAFCKGLAASGYRVVADLADPRPGDIVVIWNRYGRSDAEARRFEAAGARAVVTENGLLGKAWRGGDWYALAIGHHAGAGDWNVGGAERWDAMSVELAPWREGGETVILAQRGIGEPGVRSPDGWAENVQRRIGGRVRAHPGKSADSGIPLVHDLRNAGQVVTWHSAGALQALLMGIPVWHDFDRWIGAQAARPLALYGTAPKRSDVHRLAMFRHLAWAMWDLKEIANGTAFGHLLGA